MRSTILSFLAVFASQSWALTDDVIVDDSSSLISYTAPSVPWVPKVGESSYGLYNNTDTLGYQQDAKATFKFNGTMIQYWGTRGPNLGRCRVYIDKEDKGLVNSHTTSYEVPVVLFQATNLSPGEHVINVIVEDAAYPNTCEIDRFIYTPIDPTAVPPTRKATPNINAIIGGAVGGGVGLFLFLVLLWLWIRNRRSAGVFQPSPESQVPPSAPNSPGPPPYGRDNNQEKGTSANVSFR